VVARSSRLSRFIIGGNPWNPIGYYQKEFSLADEDLYLYKLELNMSRNGMYRGVTCDFMKVHNSLRHMLRNLGKLQLRNYCAIFTYCTKMIK